MGADLIGFIVKGPKEVGGNKLGLERARHNYDEFRQLVDDFETADNDDDRSAVINGWEDRNRGNLADFQGHGTPMDEYIPDCSAILGFEGAATVDEWVEWWDGGCAGRDVMSRLDPDNGALKIVSVGELSWGDEPEGLGYQQIKFALWCGIAAPLGIR